MPPYFVTLCDAGAFRDAAAFLRILKDANSTTAAAEMISFTCSDNTCLNREFGIY